MIASWTSNKTDAYNYYTDYQYNSNDKNNILLINKKQIRFTNNFSSNYFFKCKNCIKNLS